MFKKFCTIITIVLVVFSTGLFWSPSVSALEPGDIVMSLNPSERELELNPGETIKSSVGISNVGRLPFDVRASVSPYYVSGDDYKPDFENETAYTKLYNWITLEQNSYHLEPGEAAQVHFTVNVPDGVVGGGQYAAIMLLSDSGIEEEGAVKVQGQLAAIIYGHVNGGEMISDGVLVDHTLPAFMFNDKISVSQVVRNNGNVDFHVKQTMTITNFITNQPVVTINSVDNNGQMIGYNIATVLPGTSRAGILTWSDAPKLGLFMVKQTISFLDKDYEFSQLVLICPIWLVILVIALLIILVMRIIFKIKKYRHSRPQVY